MTRETVDAVTIHYISEERITFDVHMSSGRSVAIDWSSDEPESGMPLYHLCRSLGISLLQDTDELIGRTVLTEAERSALLFGEGGVIDPPARLH